jgi:hypothetical protein
VGTYPLDGDYVACAVDGLYLGPSSFLLQAEKFAQWLDFLARTVVRPWFGVEHSKCAEDLIVYRCLAGDRFLPKNLGG